MAQRARALEDDPTIYPEEEKVGEESLQRFICEFLRPLLERYLASRGELAFVGADQFIYYRRHDPHGRVAPDVYVLPGVRPGRRIRTWKTWIDGPPPSFALEVVSRDVEKDYVDAPMRHAEAGTQELVVFDPDFEDDPDRLRFQVFRRLAKRGLVRVQVTNEDRVRSKTLGCWIRAVGVGETQRLRIAVGKDGSELFPTAEEEASLERARERAEKERERAEKERERAEKERERAEKEREQAEKERAQAEKEREQAEKERAQAEKERAQAEKERAQAEKERALAELQRERAARIAAERELARLRSRKR